MKNIDSKDRNNRWLSMFLFLLLFTALCQLVITAYFNIFEPVEHMGLDASWVYTKVNLSIREGAIYPNDVINTTTQPEFEKNIFVVPLYFLFKNVFVAYGIVNIIITIICILILCKIGENFNFNVGQKLLLTNLFLCPYLANGFDLVNDLGYFTCVNGFAAFYSISTLAILLLIMCVTYKEENTHRVIKLVTLILMLYVGLAKGTGILVWIGSPIIVYIIVKALIKNDFRVLINEKEIFMILSIVAVILGRLLGGFLGYGYLDSTIRWVNADELIRNIGNVILGFVLLLGGLPGEGVQRSPMSFFGLVYIFGLFISIIFLFAIGYFCLSIIKKIKDKVINDNVLFLLLVILVNALVYVFIVPYNVGAVFEIRYLIPAIHAGFILMVLFIYKPQDNLLIRKAGCILLLISIIGMDLYSDYFLAITDNRELHADELLVSIKSTDAGLVYFWDSEKNLVHPERVLRALDPDRVYKSVSFRNMLENMGDYKYYDDSKEYDGPTVLVINTGDKPLDTHILDQYKLLEEIGEYSVLYCRHNPIDLLVMTEDNQSCSDVR